MGIFGALNTAVSGLRAQSYAMENISGNIANSQTIGFKRTDTSFIDLVADRPRQQTLSGTVTAIGIQTTTLQGDVRPTSIATNMAINGPGLFAVSQVSGYSDGVPTFSNASVFTRRGDFETDKDGYLVNGAGYFLRGDSISPTTGLVTSTNGIIRINDDAIPARATSEIEFSAILPSVPATSNYRQGVAESDYLAEENFPYADPPVAIGDFANDPRFGGDGVVQGVDGARFLSGSISGGSTIVYNEIGAPIDVQLRWAKVSSTATDVTWNLFYQNNSQATGTAPMWRALGQATFDASGAVDNSSFPVLPDPTIINGTSISGLDFSVGSAGLRQFASNSGLVQGLQLSQNGYPSGILQDVSVSSDGRIIGTYSNGQALPIARVTIAQFAAPNALKAIDGGAFERTIESGEPVYTNDGMRLMSGSVEQSNADIAEEFSKMIVTQQAYAANTRVVSTAQEMMEATMRMVR